MYITTNTKLIIENCYIKINKADHMCYLFKSIFNTFLMFECYGLHNLYEIDDPVGPQTTTKSH
jgi:hypothetical protein